MNAFLNALDSITDDQIEVATVRSVCDNGRLMVQIAGRGGDVIVSPIAGMRTMPDDEIIVVRLGTGANMVRTAVCLSPFRMGGGTAALVGAGPYQWSDVDGIDDAVTDEIDVARNAADMHVRQHSLTGHLDHDASGTPAAMSVLVYGRSAGAWAPGTGASRLARKLMLMGM